MCEFFSVGKTHPHAGVSKKRTKIPFLIGTGTNKTKKKRPFPQKKTKTIQKHHFRKLHVSTPPCTDGIITTPPFHILSPLYSTSATTLIPLPSPPLFRFHHYPPYTVPKSTSSTSASRHRRHRLTDVDDVDLEGVEQRGKRMCRYRTYTYAVTIIFPTAVP